MHIVGVWASGHRHVNGESGCRVVDRSSYLIHSGRDENKTVQDELAFSVGHKTDILDIRRRASGLDGGEGLLAFGLAQDRQRVQARR